MNALITSWFLLTAENKEMVSVRTISFVLNLAVSLPSLWQTVHAPWCIKQTRSILRSSVTAFVIYLAWICVATIANTTALLVYVQWNALGMEQWIWSCIMIVIAFLLTLFFILQDCRGPGARLGRRRAQAKLNDLRPTPSSITRRHRAANDEQATRDAGCDLPSPKRLPSHAHQAIPSHIGALPTTHPHTRLVRAAKRHV